MCKFSIITVVLNPGDILKPTLESIEKQSFKDFEVIIKDAGSKEELKGIPKDPRFKLFVKKDAGIYDAMNQAVELSLGEYIIFINAGDALYDENTLERIYGKFKDVKNKRLISYGDTYFALSKSLSRAPLKITPSVCYRNIPCHQSIVYSSQTLKERNFDIKYKIRADYEHFLFSFFKTETEFLYLDTVISSYEGGGFSENKKNRARDKKEYREIVKKYIPLKDRFLARLLLIVTFHRLRGLLARNPKYAAFYQKLKEKLLK